MDKFLEVCLAVLCAMAVVVAVAGSAVAVYAAVTLIWGMV